MATSLLLPRTSRNSIDWKSGRGRMKSKMARGNDAPGVERLPVQLATNQSLLPLVDQDVGDGGFAGGSQLAAAGGIAGRQVLKFFPAGFGSEQGLQLFFPLLERFRLGHG